MPQLSDKKLEKMLEKAEKAGYTRGYRTGRSTSGTRTRYLKGALGSLVLGGSLALSGLNSTYAAGYDIVKERAEEKTSGIVNSAIYGIGQVGFFILPSSNKSLVAGAHLLNGDFLGAAYAVHEEANKVLLTSAGIGTSLLITSLVPTVFTQERKKKSKKITKKTATKNISIGVAALSLPYLIPESAELGIDKVREHYQSLEKNTKKEYTIDELLDIPYRVLHKETKEWEFFYSGVASTILLPAGISAYRRRRK